MISWLSPKTEKRESPIHGTGLYAKALIHRGELVAVKGGQIFDTARRAELSGGLEDAYIQIEADLFIGPLKVEDLFASMMHLNHSCAPNAGVAGQVTFVAMRDIAPGEEVTMDYAMTDDEDSAMACACGAQECRDVITGHDWQRPELQDRYRGYFSRYLAERIGSSSDSDGTVAKFARVIPELNCSDLTRSLAFYREILGFSVMFDRPEERFVFLDRGGAQLMIEEPVGRAFLAGELEAPYGRGINLQIEVPDVDVLYGAVRQAGCSIPLPLEEKWYRANAEELGNRQFVVQDPDGYMLRFFTDLGSRPLGVLT